MEKLQKEDLLRNERYKGTKDWTLGRLYVRGEFDGFVVEDEIRDKKVPRETAIGAGRYKLGFRLSPKFSRHFLWSKKAGRLIPNLDYSKNPKSEFYEVWKKFTDWVEHSVIWVLDVLGFQFILLHWGNTDLDTEGCLVVGNKIGILKGREAVLDSRKYYMKLYEKIFPLVEKGNEFITITNPTK